MVVVVLMITIILGVRALVIVMHLTHPLNARLFTRGRWALCWALHCWVALRAALRRANALYGTLLTRANFRAFGVAEAVAGGLLLLTKAAALRGRLLGDRLPACGAGGAWALSV